MNQPTPSGRKRIATTIGGDLGGRRFRGSGDLRKASARDRLRTAEREGGKYRDAVAAQIADLVICWTAPLPSGSTATHPTHQRALLGGR